MELVVINRLAALFLILLTSPILLTISLAIMYDSPGPVIFRQVRVGRNNARFTMYKFRSMVVGMPDLPSEQVGENDSRFTKLGKLIRRFSIDELPQLINIVKGEMNFIGPRPALYNQYDLIAMRELAGVNALKPGITGWAQVNGRDSISLEKKVELDKYYLENQGVWLNAKILFRTVFKSVSGDGLYGKTANSETVTPKIRVEE